MGMAMPVPVPPVDIGESITAGNGSNYLSRSFSMSSSDDTNSNIMFSAPGSKKAKVLRAGWQEGQGAHRQRRRHGHYLQQNQIPIWPVEHVLDMPGMDDYLQLQQDFVACTVRTKRGCATHPRSIAERERRTRISKRLRRLQDLVPNLDKQTNTLDMLDIAVDYIKVMQDQIEIRVIRS